MEILGIVLILLSAAGAIFSLLGRIDGELDGLKALTELIGYVKMSVENYSMSASEILRRCDVGLLERLGYPKGAPRPSGFSELYENSYVADRTAREAFGSFAADFGKSYRLEQTRQCQSFAELLRVRVSELEAALPARRKMIISLCTSAALALVILLL